MKTLLAIAGALAVVCHLSHQALLGKKLPDVPRGRSDTLASPEALRLLSLGYGELGADYYWLRAISHFGDKRMHKYHYPNLWPLLERVIALDPKFASAYVMAGQSLAFAGMDTTVPMRVLQQGMLERPDNWRIPFVLGFEAYYLKNNYALAADALSRAASLPGAPEYLGPFAARLAAEAGEPEIGIQFIDAMLHTETDPAIIAGYQKRRTLLMLEVYLKQLNAAVAAYKEQQHKSPSTLQDLVTAGLVPSIPPDPLGGAFFLDPNKRVQTTHEAERMKLPEAAKRLHRKAPKAEANAAP